MANRERIIEAASRVYSLHGFRGATTRLIANEAGVNEVTLFRIFGSKAALLNEVAQRVSSEARGDALPVRPRDPESEVTAWAAEQLAHMWQRCSMIRKTMSEMEDRPDLCSCIAVGPTSAIKRLRVYVDALKTAGMADADLDSLTPSAMLLGAIFADGMGRDFMPEIYPPADEAANAYARIFLRSIGADAGTARKRRPATARKRATSSRRKAS